ncbi:hypothetical protein MT997_15660 [Paenibacillus sp. OVF10]|nr:hypothetical protein MT997_15660 [Paenibacillus sp. OVF10]
MTYEAVITYEQAVQRIQSIGLLPLAPLFADYPSLSSLTPKNIGTRMMNSIPGYGVHAWLKRALLHMENLSKRKRFLSHLNTSLGYTDCWPIPEPSTNSMKRVYSPVRRSNSMR